MSEAFPSRAVGPTPHLQDLSPISQCCRTRCQFVLFKYLIQLNIKPLPGPNYSQIDSRLCCQPGILPFQSSDQLGGGAGREGAWRWGRRAQRWHPAHSGPGRRQMAWAPPWAWPGTQSMFLYSPKQKSVSNSRRWDHLSPGGAPAFLATARSGWKHSLEVGHVGIPLGRGTLGAKTWSSV